MKSETRKVVIPLLLRKDGKPRKRQKHLFVSLNGYGYVLKRGVELLVNKEIKQLLFEAGFLGMKRHLVFCCNYQCLRVEMRKIITKDSLVNYTEQTVINGDDEYRFYSQINESKERLYGLLLDDYRTCGNYILDEHLVAILRSHIGRKR